MTTRNVRRPRGPALLVATRKGAEGAGTTVGDVLADLDGRFPGLRFRIIDEQDRVRPHIRLFVGMRPAQDLAEPVRPVDEVHILCALSGGL